jgi:CubicO group peptidase (beta-lactamase class C family)
VLTVEIDPAQAGFEPERLNRIDRHYQRYVDEGKLPGFLALIARDGQVVHIAKGGYRDVEAGLPVELDTQFRIYSMTKPITSVAAMLLWEEGAFELKDPVEQFIPAFKDARVWAGGSQNKPVTVPATEPVRIWHLLTHTAGLTYGFHYAEPLDGIYRDHGFVYGSPKGMTLEQCTDAWAQLPLLFEPGSEFNYSVATDVLGRLIEVLSGQPLDVFFRERIFEPLQMTDTSFGHADPDRCAALYTPGLVRDDRMGSAAFGEPRFLSGGGGVVWTAPPNHPEKSQRVGGGCGLK